MSVFSVGDLCLDIDVFVGEELGGQRRIESLEIVPGGSAGNVAVACYSVGVRAGLLAPVCGDLAGRILVEELKKKCPGLKLFLRKGAGSRMSCVVINIIGSRGIRKVYYSDGPQLRDLDEAVEIARTFNAVHLSGYSLEITPRGSVTGFLRKLSAESVARSFDLFPRAFIFRDEILGEIARNTDVMFGNEAEWKKLLNASSTKELIEALRRVPARIKVVKRGGRGALAVVGGKVIREKALKVKPVKLKGAGDVFAAVFLSMLTRDYSLEEALSVATRTSSIYVSGASVENAYKKALESTEKA